MTDFNTLHNRVVWFDLPAADLERASSFYRAVLACGVDLEDFDGFRFAVLEHEQGNGGCLVPAASEVSADRGALLYFNVEGRLRDAVAQVRRHGGSVLQDAHPIGPHGWRAIVIDSEGNRIALHASADA
jgi:uncharacterized protein